jgi:N-acetyl-gamma-glutamyl-phosphate reductase
MIKAGIIGGTGYTAGELVRLLVNHPEAELRWISSTSQAGKRVDSVHQGLTGDTDLVFSSSTPLDDIDVLFMCTPSRFLQAILGATQGPGAR